MKSLIEMQFYPTTKRTILYTVLVILINLAHHLPFNYWLFELFQSIYAQILIATILWAFFLIYIKQNIQSFLVFLVLAFQFYMITQMKSPLNKVPKENANVFTVMSTNILIFNTEIKKIAEEILQSSAETISLLELTQNQWEALKEHPKLLSRYPYHHMIKYHIPEQFGIGIISMYPFVTKEWVYFTNDKIPTVKTTQLTKIGLVDSVFVHAHSPLDAHGYEQRNLLLQELATMAHPKNRPYFMMGDFNLTRWSPWFQKFLKSSKLHFNSTNDFWNQTWHIFPYLPIGLHIDHFFYNDQIRVVESKIGSYTGSDHRSLTVTMKKNKARGSN